MNPIQAKVLEAQRQFESGESLDDFGDVIDLALRRLGGECRVPFEQHGDGFLVGTEKWKPYEGAAHCRTILLNRKSPVWYPDSLMSQISAFEVYCASQVAPPDDNVPDGDRGLAKEYGKDVIWGDPPSDAKRDPRRGSKLGASYGGSRQQYLTEAPPNPEHCPPSVYHQLKRYARELSNTNTHFAIEQRNEVVEWLRENSKRARETPAGDVVGTVDAWVNAQYFRGMPKSFPDARRKVADRVRKNFSHWLDKVAASDNQLSRSIAAHLREHVKVGATCEYRGDWKWKF